MISEAHNELEAHIGLVVDIGLVVHKKQGDRDGRVTHTQWEGGVGCLWNGGWGSQQAGRSQRKE